MAFPTAVNSQVTDSVSQTNTKVLGDSPALATSKLMLAVSQALSNAAHNAINAQQNNNVTAQAALTQGVNTLMNMDTAASMDVIKIYR
ncbi:glycerol-3-phosphate dehydrogenase [Pseudoalteromonas sp. HM-SA03]|uniref:RebB family R body protein n=1 Tax=Pseudoalteromonas sp. HM-SA03 TaxID=2029678 RepID=UPI000BAE1656|nr:RebB family R body protein [Pseudoalteromonas sp. HM-SA03]PAY02431.1 glycerol-3-phosphate dehydrogenase [Pseudoalteromonas sp. HM-SA03]